MFRVGLLVVISKFIRLIINCPVGCQCLVNVSEHSPANLHPLSLKTTQSLYRDILVIERLAESLATADRLVRTRCSHEVFVKNSVLHIGRCDVPAMHVVCVFIHSRLSAGIVYRHRICQDQCNSCCCYGGTHLSLIPATVYQLLMTSLPLEAILSLPSGWTTSTTNMLFILQNQQPRNSNE